MSNQELIDKLIEHEGVKSFVYNDINGYSTIGIGRCVDSRIAGSGLSIDECMYLLNNDINKFKKQIQSYDWFQQLDSVRQDAIVELCFNMGTNNFLKFKKTIAALQQKNFKLASKELLNSNWANQVGKKRANDISYRLEHGKY
jgi:lysozyme